MQRPLFTLVASLVVSLPGAAVATPTADATPDGAVGTILDRENRAGARLGLATVVRGADVPDEGVLSMVDVGFVMRVERNGSFVDLRIGGHYMVYMQDTIFDTPTPDPYGRMEASLTVGVAF